MKKRFPKCIIMKYLAIKMHDNVYTRLLYTINHNMGIYKYWLMQSFTRLIFFFF